MRFRKNTLVWAVILSMAGSVLLPASCVNAYAAQNMTEPANNLNTESDIYLTSSPVVGGQERPLCAGSDIPGQSGAEGV